MSTIDECRLEQKRLQMPLELYCNVKISTVTIHFATEKETKNQKRLRRLAVMPTHIFTRMGNSEHFNGKTSNLLRGNTGKLV